MKKYSKEKADFLENFLILLIVLEKLSLKMINGQ